MPTYKTEYVRNLTTGAPFIFVVSDEKFNFLMEEKRRKSPDSEVLLWEFSLFSSYDVILHIFRGNGYTPELMTQILTDFGLQESLISRLLGDDDYLANTIPWFSDIVHEGERAARTLGIVYDAVRKYYSPTAHTGRMDLSDYGQ